MCPQVALLEPAEGSAPGEPLQLEGMGPMVPPEEDRVLKSKSQQKVPRPRAPQRLMRNGGPEPGAQEAGAEEQAAAEGAAAATEINVK